MSRQEVTICSSPEFTDDDSDNLPPVHFRSNASNITDDSTHQINSDEDEKIMSEVAEQSTSLISEDNVVLLSSDDDSEPETMKKVSKSSIINALFPKVKVPNVWISSKTIKPSCSSNTNTNVDRNHKDKQMGNISPYKPSPASSPMKKPSQHTLNIGGVEVHFPIKPYSCQIALMFKVITGISKRQNCVLESPTGTGKTLALLCAALAWQHKERARISSVASQQYFSDDPCEPPPPSTSEPPPLPDEPFKRTLFGERSIYDGVKSESSSGSSSPGGFKRPDACRDQDELDKGDHNGLVTIHKRRKLDATCDSGPAAYPTTPEKTTSAAHTPDQSPSSRQQAETPKSVRLPRIYYGARTHKQIQQVVKEFSRTAYVGTARMSILSSREYSCIKEFSSDDKRSKNDKCKEAITTRKSKSGGNDETACAYYDNRRALARCGDLPPAWDLEDLIQVGKDIYSCPYYGARLIAETANVIFCPYNYLIDPGIRTSMQISIKDDIVILDEAHNIEDVCREAASLTLRVDEVVRAINELESRAVYTQSDLSVHVDNLVRIMKNWEYWFQNQKPLLKDVGWNTNETVHTWSGSSFATTLDNHDIGFSKYPVFSNSANYLSTQMREDSSVMYGISSATVSMLEALATTLGYMFRDSCAWIEDFKPTLVNVTTSYDESPADAGGWRSTQYRQNTQKSVISLRIHCMNPAIVFAPLQQARCVVLASGTLTPMTSLHSELACQLPLVLSAKHVVPPNRIWVGSLSTCPNGDALECTSKGSDRPSTQDALGETLLWVCSKTPNGVLCFMPSYALMNKLVKRWQETSLWDQLNRTKNVFMEARNVRDHSEIMDDYYSVVGSAKGALLIAVYRGKVSEGMDFKDEQARAVVSVGIPYPNTFEAMVNSKMKYNDANRHRNLLPGREWLRVQAYRALNQAVGRCVRHRSDWGAVLLVDARFQQPYYTEHLSKWVREGLTHHTWQSLVHSADSLESFMQHMRIQEQEEC